MGQCRHCFLVFVKVSSVFGIGISKHRDVGIGIFHICIILKPCIAYIQVTGLLLQNIIPAFIRTIDQNPRRLSGTRHLLNLAVQACCVKICAVAYWLQQQTDFSTRPIKLVHIVQSTASLPYSIPYYRAINMTCFPYSWCNL